MAAATLDILIEQGATFVLNLVWQDSTGAAIDLSLFTADMQVRSKVSDTNILLEASTANGYIVLGGPAGTIAITVPAAVTAALTATRGVYDLEITSPTGTVTRLVEGDVEVSLEVTR